MLSYILAGLALGSIYAIASASLVITYESAGILNFAFGSMAFFVARFFYWAHTQHGWSLVTAAVVSLALVGPALGVVLHLAVFRFLRNRSTLIKLVSTIGVSVALPAVALLLFGNETISQAAGLAPSPVKFWHVFGATLDLNQVIIYSFLFVILGLGAVVLRSTDIGLKVRAMVDSEALTSLSGTNPARVALGVWASAGLLAGVAGILVGPTVGVNIDSMTLLMASAFAAVVAAKLRNLVATVAVALLMGVVTDLAQYFLPANSAMTTDIVLSVPFIFILVFLFYYLVQGTSVGQESAVGGALDKAIRAEGGERAAAVASRTNSRGHPLRWYSLQSISPLVPLALIALLPELTSGYWLGLVARGLALAVVLLSFSLVTGEGGMIWLCQITFAGGGAVLAAELTTSAGVDPLLAAIVGGLAMIPLGVFIGAITIRLGELYVALVTLSFGLLVDRVVFSNSRFAAGYGGVSMSRPSFATDDKSFAFFVLVVLLLIAVAIVNLRRSTTGLATAAVRWSEPAARTLGLSVVMLKVLLAGFAAFVAGLGGAVLAMYDQAADPGTYATFGGLVLLAVLVTVGLRSITAAIIAGLSFTVVPGLFATYLPTSWGEVPTLLFGLGAVAVATNPDGVVAMHARQLQNLLFNRGSRVRTPGPRGNGSDAVRAAATAVPNRQLAVAPEVPVNGLPSRTQAQR